MIVYNEDGTVNYARLKELYKEFFSISYISHEIDKKFALIGLICYVTYKARQKDPDVTYLQIIEKLDVKQNLSEDFKRGLAIVCEDFGYGCDKFPLFGLEGKEIIKTIQNIFSEYLPF